MFIVVVVMVVGYLGCVFVLNVIVLIVVMVVVLLGVGCGNVLLFLLVKCYFVDCIGLMIVVYVMIMLIGVMLFIVIVVLIVVLVGWCGLLGLWGFVVMVVVVLWIVELVGCWGCFFVDVDGVIVFVDCEVGELLVVLIVCFLMVWVMVGMFGVIGIGVYVVFGWFL